MPNRLASYREMAFEALELLRKIEQHLAAIRRRMPNPEDHK